MKNNWKTATIIFLIIFVCLIIIDLPIVKNKIQEKQNKKTIENFINLIQEKQLGEVCNLDQGVCCNTKTGQCYRVVD